MIGSPSTQTRETTATAHDADLLIKEARRRQRRFRAGILTVVVLFAISILIVVYQNGGSSAGSQSALGKPANNTSTITHKTPTRLLECNGVAAVRPKSFIIACADGGAAVSNTHWTTWSQSHAIGTTTFVINFCVPYCAASPLTRISGAQIELSHPVKHHKTHYFTTLVVRFTHNGKVQHYRITSSPTHPL